MAVVRLVDTHHLLHRRGGQPDLVAHHGRPLGHPLADVDELDLVGVDDVDAGVGGGQRTHRNAGPFGLGEIGGQFRANGVAQHEVDSISSARTGQFYNVF